MIVRADELDLFVDMAGRNLGRLRGQVWIKSAEYRFSYVNRSFAASVGCDCREVIGATERPFFSQRIVAEFRATDAQALSANRPIMVREIGSDSGQLFETLKVPIRGASGATLGTLGVAWNVTRWQEIREFIMAPNGRCTTSAWAARAASTAMPSSVPPWLARAVVMLTADPSAGLTSAHVGHQLGFHPDSLARAFSRCFGVRLGQYRGWLRAASARDEILGSSAPLAIVALDAGYADQSHMTREFERHFGLTPAVLRRLCATNRLAAQQRVTIEARDPG